MREVTLPTGVSIRYQLSGTDGPVLLLVNGLTMDLTLWQPLAGLLADFRVLRYDQRGQGGSSKPAGPYLAEQHAGDLNALLDALEANGELPAGGVHAAALSNGAALRCWQPRSGPAGSAASRCCTPI